MLPSHWSQRNAMVPDLVRCYGACGRTIVFTETKRDANDLVTALGDSVRALHGDIPQVRRGDRLPAWRTATQCCFITCSPQCRHGTRGNPMWRLSFAQGSDLQTVLLSTILKGAEDSTS